jgi:hypothetical protein
MSSAHLEQQRVEGEKFVVAHLRDVFLCIFPLFPVPRASGITSSEE